jgi:hypothetical protein
VLIQTVILKRISVDRLCHALLGSVESGFALKLMCETSILFLQQESSKELVKEVNFLSLLANKDSKSIEKIGSKYVCLCNYVIFVILTS